MARIKQRAGGDVYYAWIPKPGGGTRLVSTNCTDRRAAELRAAELEREALDPAGAAANKATANAVLDAYVRMLKRHRRSEGTLRHAQVKSGHLVRLLPARASEWTFAAFSAYVDQRQAEGARNTTIRKELRVAKAALAHARKMRLYSGDPDAVVPSIDDDYEPRKRRLSPEELMRLAHALAFPTVEITDAEREVLEYLRGVIARGHTPSTSDIAAHFGWARVNSARVYLRALKAKGLIAYEADPGMPFRDVRIVANPPTRDLLDAPEPGRNRAAWVLGAVLVAGRLSEVFRMRREHFEAAPGFTRVISTKTKRKGKGDRDVPVLPLTERLRELVLRLTAGRDELLFDRWPNIGRDIRVACKQAGIAPCSPNDLRRTLAGWLRDVGVEPQLIAEVLGHADGRMVERVYGRLTPDALAKLLAQRLDAAPRALPPRGKGGEGGGDGGATDGGAAPQSPPPAAPTAAAAPTPALRLMSGEAGEQGLSEGTADGGDVSESAIFAVVRSAQGRNRTADTGIFSPSPTAGTAPQDAGSADACSANVRDSEISESNEPPSPRVPRGGLVQPPALWVRLELDDRAVEVAAREGEPSADVAARLAAAVRRKAIPIRVDVQAARMRLDLLGGGVR